MYDITIIGAGIVGLSTAWNISMQYPQLKLCVLEKELQPAAHQSGHNSGVIHSGIYYKPGSLRAQNCRRGYAQLLVFCKEYGIPHEVCGKVIVATKESELPLLHNILQRGQENGLEGLKMMDGAGIREIEPHVQAIAGIWVPQAGIIDYRDVARQYLNLLLERGAVVRFGAKVVHITTGTQHATITTTGDSVRTRLVINCAGLYADKVAAMSGSAPDLQVLPFRGEYYALKKEREYLVKNLVYPVPNPNFPFLGVHFTRMIKGGIEAGPTAVLAFRREGYSRWQMHPRELAEILLYPGFQKLARRYWDDGWMELKRSFSKKLFVQAVQQLIPDIKPEDLERHGAGVRAMACSADGYLIDDFMIVEQKQVIDVCNAPSPAATASLAIGENIAARVARYNLT